MAAASSRFRSVREEDLDSLLVDMVEAVPEKTKFWTTSRFILKQLDNSLLISMRDSLSRDRNLELIIQLFNRNTRESLGELEKAVETLVYRLVFPQHFSFSQTTIRVSLTR